MDVVTDLFPVLGARRNQVGGRNSLVANGQAEPVWVAVRPPLLTGNPGLLLLDEMSLGLAPLVVTRL